MTTAMRQNEVNASPITANAAEKWLREQNPRRFHFPEPNTPPSPREQAILDAGFRLYNPNVHPTIPQWWPEGYIPIKGIKSFRLWDNVLTIITIGIIFLEIMFAVKGALLLFRENFSILSDIVIDIAIFCALLYTIIMTLALFSYAKERLLKINKIPHRRNVDILQVPVPDNVLKRLQTQQGMFDSIHAYGPHEAFTQSNVDPILIGSIYENDGSKKRFFIAHF